MDFDEIEYLENTVENPELKKDKSHRDDKALDYNDKDLAPRSKHKNDGDAGDRDSWTKPLKSRKESNDHGQYRSDDDFERSTKKSSSRKEYGDPEKDKRSRNGSSSRIRETGEKDRHTSGREHRARDKVDDSGKERNRDRDRDRDMERDNDRRREGKRDRRDRDYDRERNREEESERSKRSRSHLERQHDERGREKSRDMGGIDKDSKEDRKEREFRSRDHDSRRYKEKKEDAESTADPERDQRTVFAYQITLKAGERDVYDFFSKVGKVRDVQLIMDRNTRRSKGVGYIEFYDVMSVPMAIALSGQPLMGQPVMVKPSEAEKNLVQPTPAVTGGGVGSLSAGGRKLYVGNLPVTINEDQLRQVFDPFGTIELIQMPTDPGTSYCKGFAFIQFARLEDAKLAQNLNGQLQIAGRQIKVSAVTDQAAMQDTGVNIADFDDDEGNGMSLNAHSRALLMQKLDRTGTASSIMGASAMPVVGQPNVAVLPGLSAGGISMPVLTAPSIDTIGVPSECLLLKNMFDPTVETQPDFDLDIKEDCQEECAKYGKLNHIYVEKNSAGFVYLRFEHTQSSVNAQRGLHGRWFAGKMITATFIPRQDYDAKFPDRS